MFFSGLQQLKSEDLTGFLGILQPEKSKRYQKKYLFLYQKVLLYIFYHQFINAETDWKYRFLDLIQPNTFKYSV